MNIVVNVHEAKAYLSRLLGQAHTGQKIVVANAGKPHAQLAAPATEPGCRRPGQLSGRLGESFLEPLRPKELDAWVPR